MTVQTMTTATAPATPGPRFAPAPKSAGELVPWMPDELKGTDITIAEWEELGASRAAWRTIKNILYPECKDPRMLALVMARCAALKVDILQKPFHIVSTYDSKSEKYVESVWPAITWYRIVAHRTGDYAGMSEPVIGPMVTRQFTKPAGRNYPAETYTVQFPEFITTTAYRIVKGVRCPFPATVWWMEAFAAAYGIPNAMWRKRPLGQLLKCAEAAALRAAFPEVGGEPTADEMEGRTIGDAVDVTPTPAAAPAKEPRSRLDGLKTAAGIKPAEEVKPEPVIDVKPEPAKAEPAKAAAPPAPKPDEEEPPPYTLVIPLDAEATHTETHASTSKYLAAHARVAAEIVDRVAEPAELRPELTRFVALNAKETARAVDVANQFAPKSLASWNTKIAAAWNAVGGQPQSDQPAVATTGK